MSFRTEIKIYQPIIADKIAYDAKVLFLGSCFSDNIGAKFSYFKFDSLTNPFGILFHPLAISKLVERAIKEESYTEEDLVYHNEQYHCFDVHSSFSHPDSKVLLEKTNSTLKDVKTFIINATHVVLTFGTSWVYEYIPDGKIVANCHKIPQKDFRKRLLSPQEIETSLEKLRQVIRSENKEVQFITTISPVRHLKDGFVENQLSKAHLLTAIHHDQLSDNFKTQYFPSYEIMMDDLRDYRFYKSDMLHPNQLAVDYIWEQFKTTWIDEKVFPVMDEIEQIQKGLSHKPFNPDSDAHQKFLKKLQEKIEKLREQYPMMKF